MREEKNLEKGGYEHACLFLEKNSRNWWRDELSRGGEQTGRGVGSFQPYASFRVFFCTKKLKQIC